MNELRERYNDNGELIVEVYASEYAELQHEANKLATRRRSF